MRPFYTSLSSGLLSAKGHAYEIPVLRISLSYYLPSLADLGADESDTQSLFRVCSFLRLSLLFPHLHNIPSAGGNTPAAKY